MNSLNSASPSRSIHLYSFSSATHSPPTWHPWASRLSSGMSLPLLYSLNFYSTFNTWPLLSFESEDDRFVLSHPLRSPCHHLQRTTHEALGSFSVRHLCLSLHCQLPEGWRCLHPTGPSTGAHLVGVSKSLSQYECESH